MNAVTRHRDLLRKTDEQIAATQAVIESYPEEKGLLLELKSLENVRRQLESETITITGRMTDFDADEGAFRLEMGDGAILVGRITEKAL